MKTYIVMLIGLIFPLVVSAQTPTENYVKTTTYQVATQNGTTDLQNVPLSDDDKLESLTYFDGIGRPKQAVNKQGGGDRENIVTHMEYNALGLQTKEYLPWASAAGAGTAFIEPGTLRGDIHTFYNTPKYESTLNPYSQTRLDLSPEQRVLEQGAPGNPWAVNDTLDTDHTIKYEYHTNYSNEVLRFKVNFIGGITDQPDLALQSFHPEGSLFKTVTKDENWQPGDGDARTVHEYTNKRGQVVLKRIFNSIGGSVQQVNTYYVYDDFGNLTFVLSPEASANIIDNGALAANTPALLDGLSYQYKYDYRNRLIEKKLPGKGWEYIVYDDLDRPILTQDAEQRLQGKWLFTKYDALGRVAYTGVYNSSATRQTAQSTATGSTPMWETRTQTANTISGSSVYYTHSSYPSTASLLDVLTINYYDDYAVDFTPLSLPATVYGVTRSDDVHGMPTVSFVRVLDLTVDDWIVSITGYDNLGRTIYSASRNEYLNTADEVQSLLDFTGKPTETMTTHVRGGAANIVTLDYFTYDHAGRLLTHEQKIDSEPVQLIAENVYDELGQLVKKHVGGQTFLDGYTDITNANVTAQGMITKESNTNLWDAGAKTKGEVVGQGGVQIKVSQIGKMRFGMETATGGSSAWEVYDHGMELTDNGFGGFDVTLIIGGVLQSSPVTTANIQDVLSVERIGTQVYFKKNGSGSLGSAAIGSDAMVGKIGLFDQNAGAEDFVLYGAVDSVLQYVDYAYNVRGWLTNINDVENDFTGEDAEMDLFAFKINYTSIEEDAAAAVPQADPLYNGNIAQTLWRTRNTDKNKRGYAYGYDDMNRSNIAYHRKGNNLETPDDFSLWNVGYDRNGNIKNLNRSGGLANTWWDVLTYDYIADSNKLVNVNDNSTCSCKDKGFNDGNTAYGDYVYDHNGNMTVDNNKGITNIIYNHLNLPERVEFGPNDKIEYLYDASGAKLEKVVTEGSSVTATVEYAGNYLYLDGTLEFFNHPEGYVFMVANTTQQTKGHKNGQTTYSNFEYVFQHKDHLGNIRLSYSDADLNGSIAESEIVEESNYFPFGLKQWGYNFNQQGGNDLAQ